MARAGRICSGGTRPMTAASESGGLGAGLSIDPPLLVMGCLAWVGVWGPGLTGPAPILE
jgi:hypothetical protein